METNKIYQGDCIEELKKLDENSIDAPTIFKMKLSEYRTDKDVWKDIIKHKNQLDKALYELWRMYEKVTNDTE